MRSPFGPSYSLPHPVSTANTNTANKAIQWKVAPARAIGLIALIKEYYSISPVTQLITIKIKELVNGMITDSVLAKPSSRLERR